MGVWDGRYGHIRALIEYVEANLAAGLDARLLSALGLTSHTRLYRDFYSVTGHSVKGMCESAGSRTPWR